MKQIVHITLIIVLCHFLTGTASVVTRYLVSVFNPVDIAFLRYLFGTLILLPLYFIYRVRGLDRPLLIRITGLGILFFALFPFLFSLAFVYTSAARGSLVLATMPVWTMLIGKAMGHDQITGLSLIAVVLTLLGLVIALSDKLSTGGDYVVLFKGEAIMLITALVGACYAIFSRQVLKQMPASVFTTLAMFAGCLCLLPFAINNDIHLHVIAMSRTQLQLMIYLGAVAGGIAFFLFNWTLNRTTATFTTLFVPLNPITAIFLGHLFLGEIIRPNFIVGVLIVFTGLGFAVRSQVSQHALLPVGREP